MLKNLMYFLNNKVRFKTHVHVYVRKYLLTYVLHMYVCMCARIYGSMVCFSFH